jgi:DNA ligase 1
MPLFKPMLACREITRMDTIRYPVLVSRKLDGVRATVQEGKLYSRHLKLIPNRYTQELFSSLPEGLDGELICGPPNAPDVFRRTMSAVMSHDGEPNVKYYIFDRFEDDPFYRRLASAVLCYPPRRNVEVIEHPSASNRDELDVFEEKFVSEGYEGLMIRDPNGLYKQGRSTEREGWLMKLKRFKDGEAIIIGFEEQLQNTNEGVRELTGRLKRSSHKANMVPKGTLGSLRVREIETGVEFNVGSGLDDHLRQAIWDSRELYINKTITYKHQPNRGKDKPSIPIFKGFRED